MTDFNERSGASSDLDAFEAWLEETAEREDAEREDVINKLMSTYWILSELSGLMKETEYAEMVDDDTQQAGEHGELIEVLQSIADINTPRSIPEPNAGAAAIDPSLIQLIEVIAEQEGGGAGGGREGATRYRVEKLRDEVETLTRELARIDQETEELDASYGSRGDHLRERLDRLEHAVDELEDALTWTPDLERIGRLESRIEAVEAELSGDVEALDDRFEDAYASLATILEHLLASTEDNEHRFDALVDVLTEELEGLATARAEAEALAELKREASELGVRSPRCDSCDAVVDPALLSKPACPSCDRRVTGFETKSRFLRTREIARTRASRDETEPERPFTRKLGERLDAAEPGPGVELGEDLPLEEGEEEED